MLAFNVSSQLFETVPPYLCGEEWYDCNKPHAKPYQDPSMKARVLWQHKKEKYIIWTSGKAVLKLDMEEGTGALVGTEVGDTINAYKLDKAAYAERLQKHKAGAERLQKHKAFAVEDTSTTSANTTSAKSDGKKNLRKTDKRRVELNDDDLDEIDRNTGVRVEIEGASSSAGGLVCQKSPIPKVVEAEGLKLDTKAEDLENKGKQEVDKDSGKQEVDKDSGKQEVDKVDKAKIEALQRDLATEQKRANDAERKHKAYIQRKQREMKTLVSQEALERARAETVEVKAELSKAQTVVSLVSDEDRQALIASKKNPRVCYLELIRLCTERFKELIRNLSVSVDKTDGEEELAFEYYDNCWLPITDNTVKAALCSLYNTSMKMAAGATNDVDYSFRGQNYTTELKVGTSPVIDAVAQQKNHDTNVVRSIRVRRVVGGQSSVEDQRKGFEVLFGSESIVALDDDFVESMLKDLRFDLDISYEMFRGLAELIELHSSLASKFKYCVDAGTQPISTSAEHFVSHTDGEKDFNSELFIKPMALFNWLSIARARGYKAARVLLHGCGFDAYEGMRADPIGFDMQYAGKNGQAYGTGVYCGLSDHATVNFTSGRGFAPGSCIVALLLTKESVGWQHNHGGYSKATVDTSTQYKTIKYGSPDANQDNAIVVHETPLLLQLGHVRAFDPVKGWGVSNKSQKRK